MDEPKDAVISSTSSLKHEGELLGVSGIKQAIFDKIEEVPQTNDSLRAPLYFSHGKVVIVKYSGEDGVRSVYVTQITEDFADFKAGELFIRRDIKGAYDSDGYLSRLDTYEYWTVGEKVLQKYCPESYSALYPVEEVDDPVGFLQDALAIITEYGNTNRIAQMPSQPIPPRPQPKVVNEIKRIGP